MSSVDPSKDLTSSNDKQNALDAIPTSSTDANVTFAKAESAIEDPISSTSSEVCPLKCSEEETDNFVVSDNISSAGMGQSKSTEQEKSAAMESEEEFLNLNMENVSNEHITEDVEDIVHDLENLLGDSYNTSGKGSKAAVKTNEDVPVTLLEFEELTRKDDNAPSEVKSEQQIVITEEEKSEEITVTTIAPPSVEFNEAVEVVPEESKPIQENAATEPSNEESEVVPIVTEPDDTTNETVSISTNKNTCEVEETDEIHSTIQENSSPPSKPQKVRLVRSPVNILVKETEQTESQIEHAVQVPAEKLSDDCELIVSESQEEEEEKSSTRDEFQVNVNIESQENENRDDADIVSVKTPPMGENTMEAEECPEVGNEIVQPIANELTQMEIELPQQKEEVETFSPELVQEEEPMMIEEDKNEIEMKEVVVDEEEPILIDDPVVATGIDTADLTAQIDDDVPAELQPPSASDLNEINTESIVPVDDDQLIAESTVMDELIETTALDSIVTETITNTLPEKLEVEDVTDSLNLDIEPPSLEDVIMVETVNETENDQTVLECKEPTLENVQIPLEMEEPTSKTLETTAENLDNITEVFCEEKTIANETTNEEELSCVSQVNIAEVTTAVEQLEQEVESRKPFDIQHQEEIEVKIIDKTPDHPDVATQKETVSLQKSDTITELVQVESNVESMQSIDSKSLEKTEPPLVVTHKINPCLQTTLTVDVSEQETATMYDHDEVAMLPSPKTAIKQESQHLLKITISKQADNTHSILKVYNPEDSGQSSENIEKVPKISIKPLLSPQDSSKKTSKLMSPTSIPKVTIKPIVKPESPVKLTIKPIVKPDEIHEQQQKCSPKLTIKPIVKPEEMFEQQRSSPKLTIKPIVKPDETYEQQKASPKLTIKPIIKPDDELHHEQQTKTFEVAIQEQDEQQGQARSSPKITIKSVVKHEVEETQKQKFSPKLTIKPIIKPEETIDLEQYQQRSSPKLTIKPIVKPEETVGQEEQKHPKLTIKPIVRPDEQMHSPKITIKPVIKPQEEAETHSTRHNLRFTKTDETHEDVVMKPVEEYEQKIHGRISTKVDCPKVTIKPVIKPTETTSQVVDIVESEEEIKQERIILKINKNTLPSRKREHGDDGGEKLAKIKVKYSKEGGHAHIVPQSIDSVIKYPQPEVDAELRKRFKLDDINIPQGVTITNVEPGHSRQKEVTSSFQEPTADDVKIEPIERVDTSVFPITQPVIDLETKDPLGDIPSFENAVQFGAATCTPNPIAATVVSVPSPRRRGRPRKVPLEVREDFKDPPKEEEQSPAVIESTRPKRSCRGPSVRATLGIKPRKPRGPGRGRGGKRGVETRATVMKAEKEPRVSIPKLKLLKETITNAFLGETVETEVEQVKEIDNKSDIIDTTLESRDVPIYEEETRMSADAGSSRAQTPAKQVPTPIGDVVVEESQSSVQSTATTESVKGRRGPRLEVHQEPEGAIISADQLAEYSWGGGGPYMLQEQVAQFLGIKSFKRKYPGIQRRAVEMQERDFIRESGLASEAMCDLGLTAVNSADILDIMYSDFQPKYEEYCKHQRNRQAKDLTNKQKALTLVVSQEKNNLTEQAIQSAAAWNLSFNKGRREKRKACMDLQTFTIHYPKGKVKQINKPPVGNYPVALVPGQFTDYYKEFTPTELNNLPINTVCYNNMARHEDDSQSDGSASDTDSSSSDSDSSDTGSSEGENCTMCSPRTSQKQISSIHLVL